MCRHLTSTACVCMNTNQTYFISTPVNNCYCLCEHCYHKHFVSTSARIGCYPLLNSRQILCDQRYAPLTTVRMTAPMCIFYCDSVHKTLFATLSVSITATTSAVSPAPAESLLSPLSFVVSPLVFPSVVNSISCFTPFSTHST